MSQYYIRSAYIINVIFFTLNIVKHDVVIQVIASLLVNFRCNTRTINTV